MYTVANYAFSKNNMYFVLNPNKFFPRDLPPPPPIIQNELELV